MTKTINRIILSLFLCTIASSVISTDTVPAHTFDVNIPQDPEKPIRRKRMRKSSKKEKNETKKIRTYMDMEYEQLVHAKDIQKANGNTTATIKYLEQLLKISTDITLLSQHLLELADALFDDKQFQKSAFVYNQYCALYPGSEKQEYALYRSIVSSFACILSIDRDQSKTEETLALTELFLKEEHFNIYRTEVMQVQKQCYEHLAASECNICTFYLNKGSLKAVEKRLSRMRSFWLPKLPTLEPEIIAFEAQVAEKKNLLELLHSKKTELAQNSKKHMANRF
jgi:outer membrane assembly lipoprotein YfiO